MWHHIRNKVYHVEVLPPKQDSEKLDKDLELFATRYKRVLKSGYSVCITDNAMGLLSFQGAEMIAELELPVSPEQVIIHLNTFHTREDLDHILEFCADKGIRYLLVVSGDGSERLPKLKPSDVGAEGVESVTSVELLRYIGQNYPEKFTLGVAFNPYEPAEHEFEKMERKIAAGASFIITQPLIQQNAVVDRLLEKYPGMPVIIEAWMSKKLSLLSEAVGYTIPEDTEYDPIAALKMIHRTHPNCGVYLSLLSFKTQYELLKETWR